MAQLSLSVNGGNPPFTVSIRKSGDISERWISGGNNGNDTVFFNADVGNNDYEIILSDNNSCVSNTVLVSLNC